MRTGAKAIKQQPAARVTPLLPTEGINYNQFNYASVKSLRLSGSPDPEDADQSIN